MYRLFILDGHLSIELLNILSGKGDMLYDLKLQKIIPSKSLENL